MMIKSSNLLVTSSWIPTFESPGCPDNKKKKPAPTPQMSISTALPGSAAKHGVGPQGGQQLFEAASHGGL